MNNSRYEELCAQEAENRLVSFEHAKDTLRKMFMAVYGKLLVSPDGNYTLNGTWQSIEEAIDDFTHLDRAEAEKTIAEYETASKRSHERSESTFYAGPNHAH